MEDHRVTTVVIYTDSIDVVMCDDTYRWVNAANFSLTETVREPGAALEHLLASEQYVNHYETADRVATHQTAADRQAEGQARWAELLDHPGGVSEVAAKNSEFAGRLHEPYRPPEDPTHGPYFMRFIGPHAFDPIPASAGRSELVAWLRGEDGDNYPSPPAVEGDLDAILGLFIDQVTVFRLRDLGEAAEHPSGWIVHPYLELVIVDLASRALHIVAAGTD